MEGFKLENYLTPVPRKLMSKQEIKWAENMVKKGLMFKGKTDDSKKSVMYYAERLSEMELIAQELCK